MEGELMTEPTTTACYRHPDRPTRLGCSRCGRPICNECAIATPVGYRCPECIEELQSRSAVPEPAPAQRAGTAPPRFTYFFLGLIAVIYVLEELAGGSTNPAVLIRFGATYGPLLFQGELWRLFTAMFVHIGITHLFFNGFALHFIGREVEAVYGHARFLFLYFGAGLLGNVVSFAWRGMMEFSAGASGAIFGILGAELAFLFYHRNRLGDAGRAARNQILRIIVINIIIGVTIVSINNAAHMGGLISGFILGYLVAPRFEAARGAPGGYRDLGALSQRWWVVLATIIAIIGGTWAARTAWINYPEAMSRYTTLPGTGSPSRENAPGRLRDLFADPTPTPTSSNNAPVAPAAPLAYRASTTATASLPVPDSRSPLPPPAVPPLARASRRPAPPRLRASRQRGPAAPPCCPGQSPVPPPAH
jgi:membrane associated rhomboid family serine protease